MVGSAVTFLPMYLAASWVNSSKWTSRVLSGRAQWMEFITHSEAGMKFVLFSEEGRFVRRARFIPLDGQEPSAARLDLRGLTDGRYFLAVSAVAKETSYTMRFLASQEVRR
jgi:hypothetical protein